MLILYQKNTQHCIFSVAPLYGFIVQWEYGSTAEYVSKPFVRHVIYYCEKQNILSDTLTFKMWIILGGSTSLKVVF